MINIQGEKLEKQSSLINRLENQLVKGKNSEATLTTRPITRSMNSATDVSVSKKGDRTVDKAGKHVDKDAEVDRRARNILSDKTGDGVSNPPRKNVNKPEPSKSADVEGNDYKVVRYKRRTIKGCKTGTKLKGVEGRKWIFVSRLNPETTEGEITEYLKASNISVSDCTRLEIKTKDYAAFKFAVLCSETEKVFNEDLWPVNTVVQYYRNFRVRLPLDVEVR